MKLPDQIITDLCRKCAEDVTARIELTSQLVDDPGDMMLLAISATAQALGAATGYASAMVTHGGHPPQSPEDLVDGIWAMLRPMALKAAGGNDADWRALLEKVRG